MSGYREAHGNFRWDIPGTFNFATDVVDHWAAEPDRLALIWCDDSGNERRFTFSEIADLSRQLANVLVARGIGKGDRVLVMLPRIPEWQIAMVALARLGAVAVPSVSMLTAKDIAYRVENAGITGAITTAQDAPKLSGMENVHCRLAVALDGEEVPDGWADLVDELGAASATFESPRIDAEDPTVIYFTSGSTGNPKGVTHSSRALHAWRVSAEYWLTLGPDDLMFCTADTGWSKAGTSILYGPWSRGAAVLFFHGRFDVEDRFRLLERYRVTVFCAAATEFRRLIAFDASTFDLSSLRLTVSAGESVNPEIVAQWKSLTGQPVVEAYGQTEILMLVANYPDIEIRPGSMGLPLPGTEAEVLGPDNRPVPAGTPGQLAIRLPNPQMMLAYWNEPEKTAATIVETDAGRFYLTGDNVEADSDGYLYYAGRSDDVINSAGYRIGPQEVENALMQHRSVQEAAVVASPDPERGEVVKAFIVLHAGHEASEGLVCEIQDFVKGVTAPYKYPRRIEFVDDLPKAVTGKIRRRDLREREQARAKAKG